MVSVEDVISLYEQLAVRDIDLWLIGGWGIDALLGEQTRPHKDLDVLMLVDDVARAREILRRDGYQRKEIWPENRWTIDVQGNEVATALVLRDTEGREFDAHAMRLDEEGNGVPVWDVDGLIYAPQDLAGVGTIAGTVVRCVTPKAQMRFHTGYDLPEKHWRDLIRLHETFGVAYPEGLSKDPVHIQNLMFFHEHDSSSIM